MKIDRFGKLQDNLRLTILNQIMFGYRNNKLSQWHVYKIDNNINDLYARGNSREMIMMTKDDKDYKDNKTVKK